MFSSTTGCCARTSTRKRSSCLRDRLGLNVIGVDATERFLGQLKGVTDPETKRKRIGAEFIGIFAEEARNLAAASNDSLPVKFLVQGTLYPDVIESVSVKGPSQTIKTHHNVGGLPADMPFSLIEPLRDLFKDEVRQIGRELGLPEEILVKHPFPGPGLAVRVVGEVTREKLDTLRPADRNRGGGNSSRGSIREGLAGVCSIASGAKRRSDGRRQDVRRHHRRARRGIAGRDDR